MSAKAVAKLLVEKEFLTKRQAIEVLAAEDDSRDEDAAEVIPLEPDGVEPDRVEPVRVEPVRVDAAQSDSDLGFAPLDDDEPEPVCAAVRCADRRCRFAA